MANKTLLTNAAKLYSVQSWYYSPVSITPPYTTIPDSTYMFVSHIDPWEIDSAPPTPTQDQKSLKTIMKKIFAVKKLTANDISPVLQRIDWESDTVYDYYDDNVDMTELDQNGYLVNNFYVKNKYDQVFKCLWNNNGEVSTVEPYFEPGTFSVNNIFAGNDGYKWKYMYVISPGLKVKFMNTEWMPIPTSTTSPNSISTDAGCGNIDVINITNVGSGYDAVNTTIFVTVTGDGQNCSASAVVANGEITNITVSNTGKNYTFANVTITSTNNQIGSGATAIAPISPVGGHGFDPISELGCAHVMFAPQISGSENGYIPTDITYHQVGLLVNPISQQSVNAGAPNANGEIYKTSTDLVVSGFGIFSPNETVYQGTSLETSTFSGTVLSFNDSSNLLSLINTKGTPTTDTTITSSNSVSQTVLSYTTSDYDIFSGYITYIENRSGIERSADGIEQYKIILGF
jgi:hypothetical protein